MNAREQRSAWYLLIGGLSLIALTLLGIYIVLGGLEEVFRAIASINSTYIVFGVLIVLVSESLRAVRLKVIVSQRGVSIPFSAALTARLLGRFAGTLTPASIASTPVRAGVVGAYTGLGIGEATAVTVSETLYDTFIPVLFTTALGLFGLPRTWPLLFIAAIITSLWILGLYYARTPSIEEAVARYSKRRDLWCFAKRQRELFLSTLRSNANSRLIIASITLTFASHLLESTIIGALLDWEGGILWWFIVLETSYTMTMTPTPGGALIFELGLNIILPTRVTVEWRTIFVIASLLPGVMLIILMPKLRDYLYRIASNIEECT